MMQKFVVKEVVTKKDLKRFITFVDKLYEGCEFFVQPLHKGQEYDLMKSPSLEYCKRKMWIVEDASGKVVGRICAMINPRYNDKYGKKRVRFGWFDFIDDMEVSAALLDAVTEFGRKAGMTQVAGPLGFTDFDPEGMLVEGYDKQSIFITYYTLKRKCMMSPS